MWIVYWYVDKHARKNVDPSYGDNSQSFAGVIPGSYPRRKEKIFKQLRDKQENHSPYYNY